MSDATSPLAAPERRLQARLIESVIPTIPLVLVAGLGLAIGSRTLIRIGVISSWVVAFGVLVLSAVWLHRYGQSVGKRILGLRIVRSDGSRAGVGRLFVVRELLPIAILTCLGILIPILAAIGYIVDHVPILSGPRRCIHDSIADTIVVDVRDQEPATF